MIQMFVNKSQFNETWRVIPPEERRNASEEDQKKLSCSCFPIGDVLICLDRSLPDEAINGDVKSILLEKGWQ